MSKIEELINVMNKMKQKLNIEQMLAEISVLENQQYEEWTPEIANKQKKLASIKKTLEQWQELNNDLIFFKEYSEISTEPMEEEISQLEKKVRHYSIFSYFTEDDFKDCFLDIHSGAGGVDAQEFAGRILLMYSKWAAKNDYLFHIFSESYGEEGYLKGALVKVQGPYAFGFLKGEEGIHRRVAISPFNAQSKRETSFCSVRVSPVLDESITVEINPNDLKIETFRSGGAGGQHVNTTDSRVRITHLPTGIVVQSQNERSQHQNRRNCYEALASKLYELKKREMDEKKVGEKPSIGWSNQRRSYVTHPYHLVKDHRTGFSSSRVGEILNGEIQEMLEYNILHQEDPVVSM